MEASIAPVRRRRRWPRRLGLALAGLVVGLTVAECAFRVRDHGGFPKLDVYVEDKALGVRLQPGASQRFVYPDNPITHVRINRQGYRGADFPAPGPDDVLVVGDSQVFGLGVEEHQTFAAGLERALGGGRHVLNGGVPTYGPGEYAAVARELIASRHPKTLVFTINLVNDLFEASRPNAQRHVVRDGWAVRREAAESVIDFPGRTWLARHSHLFYALRQVWHRHTDGEAVASEGTWQDLVDSGAKVEAAQRAVSVQQAQRVADLRATEAALDRATAEIDTAIARFLADELTSEDSLALQAGHRQPGDHIYDPFDGAEEARSVLVTAAQIRRGLTVRARLRDRLEKMVRAQPRVGQRAEILASLEAQPQLAARLDELVLARIDAALESPLAPVIREVAAACAAQGVRLVVLVLPIDVAVSADEWKKYRAEPIDMSSVQSLADELVALGDELGVSVVDATPALRAAEPGAFLVHDIHMTPKGHAAVAAELARALAAPPPVARASRAVSPMPLPAQWRAAPEIVVAGSTAARCETKVIREWLRVFCLPAEPYDLDGAPRAIAITSDHSHGAHVMVMPRSAALTVALKPGDSLVADFTWGRGGQQRLDVTWPADGKRPRASFTVVKKDPRPDAYRYGRVEFATDLARAMCRCWAEVYEPNDRGDGDYPECAGIYGALDDGCLAYRDACPAMVACALRDPASPPR